jgi:hypothetical protein
MPEKSDDKKKKSPEDKKKAKRKDSALRRFILRVTGANKVNAGLKGQTPEEAEAERKKERKKK